MMADWRRRWYRLTAPIHPLAARLAEDRTYRLRSHQEVQLAAELGFSLDVNQAGVDDWLRLPGISIRQAQVINHLRETGVQFYSPEDLAAALGLPPNYFQPLARVLKFCYYDPDNLSPPGRVSLNQSTVGQLGQLPGVTPTQAQIIVWERQQRGVFRDLADFQRRLQVPPEVLETLIHYLRVD
ncbi:MAG: helix-hairpin-helix domain-containing protein [Nodosilinea sp.]